MTTFNGAPITPDLLAGYDHLHVGSFFLQTGLQSELPRLFRLAHDSGLTTSLDTGWDPQERWIQNRHLVRTLTETDYFFPNESEAMALCGGEWNPPKLAGFIRGTLVIKRGANGALAVCGGHESVTVPAVVVEAVDTTGAGDAFNAGFIYSTVAAQGSLMEALRLAVACGAHAVTQVGGTTNAPTAEALQEWLKRQAVNR
jgi:sugar/nucleoside kinase (ribokinase family)